MGFSLKEFLNLNNKEKQQQSRPQPASTANAVDVREKLKNAKYGVFARNPQGQQQQELLNNLDAPKFDVTKATIGSIGDTLKSIPAGFVNTLQAPISAERLALANATGNKDAAVNARKAFQSDIENNLFSADAPFLKSTAATVLNPVSNYYQTQEVDRANRLLKPAYENMYGAYGLDKDRGTNAAELEAGNIAQGFNQDQLTRAGLNQNDSTAATIRKIGAQGAQLVANSVTQASMGNAALDRAGFGALNNRLNPGYTPPIAPTSTNLITQNKTLQAIEPYARSNAINGGSNAATTLLGTAQQDNAKFGDYLRSGLEGFGQGAVLSLGTELAGAGLGRARGASRSLNPSEVADLQQFRQKAGTPALDDVTYQKGVAAAQKAGIDYRNPTAVDDLLGSALTAQTRAIEQAQRPGVTTKLVDAFKNRQPLGEGGYVSLGAAKKAAPDLAPNQVEFINDYANMIEGMDGNGVTILPDGSRASANSPFYRQVFAETGRAPTKAEWFAEGRRQIEGGKAGFGASEDYRQLPIQGTPLPSKRGQQVTKEQPIQEQASQRPQAPLESSSTPSIPPVANDVSNILQGQKVKERGFSSTVRNAEKTPKAASIEAGNYVVKSDKQRVADAREYIKNDPTTAEQLALNPQSDMHVTIGNQLLDNYIATGQLDKFRKLSAGMAESGTELGRAIHAFADYNKTSPSGAVKFAEKTINKYNKANPNNKLSLSDGDIKGLVAKAQEVQAMPEGRARNIASHQLMEQVNNLIPSTVADKAITVWKAGLLTSPRTTMRNLIGNTLHGISETAKDIPAALNDMLLSQKTGDRSLTFTTKGTIKGARKGIMNAKDIMAFGFDPNQAIDKYDVRRVTWDKTPVQQALKTYTDFVFHAMGAQDQPFYEASFARSLYDQAGAAAKNAGKSGDKTFIKNMVDNPTEAMKMAATKDASVATFKDPNQLREIAGKLKTIAGKKETTKVISEIMAPFTGVPSSIAGQVIQYSPIGLARGVAKNAKVLGGKVTAKELPALQRAASQEIGRGVIGSGLLGVGAYLTAQGLMTGNPKDAAEARQWELEGKQANSVMVGGKWRSINSVGPEALVALAGSKIQSAKQNGDGAGKIAADIGKDFTGQTFLAGVQGPLNAISDPARYGGTYAKSQGASIVPNILKDAAKFGDKYQREQNSVGDAIKAGIPFVRDSLLPKRDALGNPLKQEPNGLGAFVDLFNSKTPIKNDVVNELSRLYSVDQSATPSKLQKSQTINGEKKKLSPAELDQLEQATGVPIQQQFKDLIATSSYKNASDELKKKSLDKIVDDVRSQAKTNITSGSNTPITSTSTKSKTTGKLSSAELTLAKDAFSKSDKSYEVVGDKVLRKSADGNVTATPKIKYDYQVGTAQLTQQKNNGDVEGWIKTANGQLESIQKQLKDPSIDPLDAISLQNDAEALQKNIDKYKGYGGFTKPKSGKKGGKGSKGGKGNYASKLNDVYKTNNTAALRNLVKASKITRKRISK